MRSAMVLSARNLSHMWGMDSWLSSVLLLHTYWLESELVMTAVALDVHCSDANGYMFAQDSEMQAAVSASVNHRGKLPYPCSRQAHKCNKGLHMSTCVQTGRQVMAMVAWGNHACKSSSCALRFQD